MQYKSVLLMFKDVQHWIKIPQDENVLEKAAEENPEDDDDGDLIVVWETAVQPLTDVQRIIFLYVTIFIAFVAIVGNILVLYVNFSRKQRFLFRACLISLAVSDLIFVATTATIYISKFRQSTVALWKLGALACSLIPFFQTMAVLVNSILLVCIALDRYMAVVRLVKGSWEPTKLFCVTCCVLIWGFSAAVSSPLLTIYDYYRIYIVPLPDPNEENPILTYYHSYLCGSDKAENGYFFAIIFVFIFAPLVSTFFWLNSVLAKEVWKRRTNVSITACANDVNSTELTGSANYVTPEIMAKRVERKQRQIRMFKVILVLMIVFFICRLPNWIYVLYKLSNNSQENIHWVLNYSLGLMVMANCMLNPFLYTFLSETIRLTTFLARIFCVVFCPCKKHFKTKPKKSDGDNKKPKVSSKL